MLNEELNKPIVSFIFSWGTERGEGLWVTPVDQDGEESSKWNLLEISSRASFPNWTTPSITSPAPVTILPVALDEKLRVASSSSGISQDALLQAQDDLKGGLELLRLNDRFEGLGSYFVRRSASGPIQTVIFTLTYAFIILIFSRWLVNILHSQVTFARLNFQRDEDLDLRVGSVSRIFRYTSKQARISDEKENRLLGIASLLNNERLTVLSIWNAEYQPFRYMLWAIPTIGFVGTIVGISQAMLATSQLADPETLSRILGRGEVSSAIGVAFDTTLVALLAVLILNLLFHDLQARESATLQSVLDRVANSVR